MRAAAAEVLSWTDVPTIDIVVNSAGVMGIAERTLSEDGLEMHFATNHIGHWLLTCSVMPKLLAAARQNPKGATRIVNVSSASPRAAKLRWSDLTFDKINRDLPEAEQPNYPWIEAWGYKDVRDKAYVGLEGYNNSKVANVLFSVGANARLFEKYGILALTVHPGVISTELGRNFPPENMKAIQAMFDAGVFKYKTRGAGAATSLVAALDPKLGPMETTKEGKENFGVYLDDCQVTDQALAGATSNEGGDRLWEVSEKLVGEKFAW